VGIVRAASIVDVRELVAVHIEQPEHRVERGSHVLGIDDDGHGGRRVEGEHEPVDVTRRDRQFRAAVTEGDRCRGRAIVVRLQLVVG
jgi:hypothetical protein